jgi:methionyl aminopeptidase
VNSPLQSILEILAALTVEGSTGKNLDSLASGLLRQQKVESAFLHYTPGGNAPTEGFPNVLCVSINGEVIHGIPDDRKFQFGDIVKLDLGLKDAEGNFDDGALTVIVGERAGSAVARRLVKTTKEALEAGVAQAKAGNTTHDIARAIYAVAQREGFSVIEGYSGHGIGTALHMAPDVPNKPVGVPVKLEAGMRLAIEPMLSSNKGYTVIDKNNKWTVKLQGGGVSAHFERTVTVK